MLKTELNSMQLEQHIENEPIINRAKRTRLNNGVQRRQRLTRIKQLLYTTVDKSVNVSELMKEPQPVT